MDLRETYNKIAEDWHNDHHSDTWWIEVVEKFVSLLKSKGKVLDVGCGSGLMSKYLVEHGFDVTGFDFAEKMIEIAKHEVPRAKFFVMDMKDVSSLPQDFYDGIFIRAAILHLPKKEVGKVLSQYAEKLKRGGLIYIAVKEQRSDKNEEGIKLEQNYGYPYERFFSYFTLEEMRRYLSGSYVIRYEKITDSGRSRWIQVIAEKL